MSRTSPTARRIPTLHLLREDSVARAVEAFPDPDAIVERNVATLRKLGVDGWRKLLVGATYSRDCNWASRD